VGLTVPAAGHIHPSLEIMRELAARGHRVTYTVTEEFAAAVEAVGARDRTFRRRRRGDRVLPTYLTVGGRGR
jgi:UDP:flavonoid glycosyltransferase YjiC (YdhE family)